MYICYMYVICDIYVCLIKVSAAHCVVANKNFCAYECSHARESFSVNPNCRIQYVAWHRVVL